MSDRTPAPQSRGETGLLVSIVINNFNYAPFLAEAVRSALTQTYPHVEVVVVDDGSTDNSRDVIASFGSSIHPLFKSNGGQASAYNAGFAASHGALVLFLDADDFLHPETIQECVRLWKPGVSKVHFYLEIVTGARAEQTGISIPSTRLAEGDLREQTLQDAHHPSPPGSGNLYARTALAEILPIPDKDYFIGADTYTIFLTALLGEVRACHRQLGGYRIHGTNWDAQLSTNAENLRMRLRKEALRDEMLRTFCESKQLHYHPGGVANQIGHLKLRLASLMLAPREHPYREDRTLSLAWKTLRVGLRSPGLAPAKRLFVAGWVLVLLTTPRPWKLRVVEIGLIPLRRSGFLSRSMSPVLSAPSRQAGTFISG